MPARCGRAHSWLPSHTRRRDPATEGAEDTGDHQRRAQAPMRIGAYVRLRRGRPSESQLGTVFLVQHFGKQSDSD